MGQPVTQFCRRCKQRKPMKGFSIGTGLCKDCKTAAAQVQTARQQRPKKPKPPPKTRNASCPRCLKQIPVGADGGLVEHLNAKRVTCRGTGHRPPQRSDDALDRRLPGSYGSGRS